MEEVGMMQQAANFYYTAVTKDAHNTDALAGMQRAGQWVLNDYLARFDEARLAGNRAGQLFLPSKKRKPTRTKSSASGLAC